MEKRVWFASLLFLLVGLVSLQTAEAITGQCPDNVCFNENRCGVYVNDPNPGGGSTLDPDEPCDAEYGCYQGSCLNKNQDSVYCNSLGGVYCTNINTCVIGTASTPVNPAASIIDCTISSSQTVPVPQGASFAFRAFKIESGSTLSFYSPADGACVGGTGGTGGAGGLGNYDGPDGGAGGDGGDSCTGGTSGTGGAGGSAGTGGAGSTVAGAAVSIYASSISIDGTISSSGGNGNKGADSGLCSDSNWLTGCNIGASGGGGGGGAGAGTITFFSSSVQGAGNILVNGGTGSDGGTSTDEDEDRCTEETDFAGPGGGGGGGAGGKVYSSSTIPTTISLSCRGGNMGRNGCFIAPNQRTGSVWGFSGQPGEPQSGGTGTDCIGSAVAGTKETSPPGVANPDKAALCNDGLDNDLDGSIDMNDNDCFNEPAQSPAGSCPSSRNGPFPNPVSVPPASRSAKNGSDGCCGDDPGFFFDLGYVFLKDNKYRYLCDNITISATETKYEWIRESDERYRIRTITLPQAP